MRRSGDTVHYIGRHCAAKLNTDHYLEVKNLTLRYEAVKSSLALGVYFFCPGCRNATDIPTTSLAL